MKKGESSRQRYCALRAPSLGGQKDGGGLGSLHGRLEAALIKVKKTTTAVRNKSKFTVPEGLGEMKTETCEEDTERF